MMTALLIMDYLLSLLLHHFDAALNILAVLDYSSSSASYEIRMKMSFVLSPSFVPSSAPILIKIMRILCRSISAFWWLLKILNFCLSLLAHHRYGSTFIF